MKRFKNMIGAVTGTAVGLVALAGVAQAQDQMQIAFIPQIAGIPYYVAMEEGADRAA